MAVRKTVCWMRAECQQKTFKQPYIVNRCEKICTTRIIVGIYVRISHHRVTLFIVVDRKRHHFHTQTNGTRRRRRRRRKTLLSEVADNII